MEVVHEGTLEVTEDGRIVLQGFAFEGTVTLDEICEYAWLEAMYRGLPVQPYVSPKYLNGKRFR